MSIGSEKLSARSATRRRPPFGLFYYPEYSNVLKIECPWSLRQSAKDEIAGEVEGLSLPVESIDTEGLGTILIYRSEEGGEWEQADVDKVANALESTVMCWFSRDAWSSIKKTDMPSCTRCISDQVSFYRHAILNEDCFGETFRVEGPRGGVCFSRDEITAENSIRTITGKALSLSA